MKNQQNSVVAAQVQVAAVKPAAKARGAAKPAAKPAEAKKVLGFAPVDYVRPVAGRNLFAFTHAWLELSGMFDGAAVNAKQLRKVCGDVAISYHVKQGNFERTEKGIALSVKGQNFFAHRVIDGKLDQPVVDAYQQIMTTGEPDGALVKDKAHIISVTA